MAINPVPGRNPTPPLIAAEFRHSGIVVSLTQIWGKSRCGCFVAPRHHPGSAIKRASIIKVWNQD